MPDVSRIHHQLCEFTLNSSFISQLHNEFTWCFAFYYRFREFTMNSFSVPRFRCRFHENTINILSASRIHYGLTIYFAKVPRIHYLFRNFNINSLSISRLHCLVSEYIKNSLSFSRIHYQNANLQFSREFTLDSQSI